MADVVDQRVTLGKQAAEAIEIGQFFAAKSFLCPAIFNPSCYQPVKDRAARLDALLFARSGRLRARVASHSQLHFRLRIYGDALQRSTKPDRKALATALSDQSSA